MNISTTFSRTQPFPTSPLGPRPASSSSMSKVRDVRSVRGIYWLFKACWVEARFSHSSAIAVARCGFDGGMRRSLRSFVVRTGRVSSRMTRDWPSSEVPTEVLRQKRFCGVCLCCAGVDFEEFHWRAVTCRAPGARLFGGRVPVARRAVRAMLEVALEVDLGMRRQVAVLRMLEEWCVAAGLGLVVVEKEGEEEAVSVGGLGASWSFDNVQWRIPWHKSSAEVIGHS